MNRLILALIAALLFLGIVSSCINDKGVTFAQPEFETEETKSFSPVCELPQGAVFGVSVTDNMFLYSFMMWKTNIL